MRAGDAETNGQTGEEAALCSAEEGVELPCFELCWQGFSTQRGFQHPTEKENGYK